MEILTSRPLQGEKVRQTQVSVYVVPNGSIQSDVEIDLINPLELTMDEEQSQELDPVN